MNCKHLSIEARSGIRKYYVEGLSYRKIAQLIGRSPNTVSREIRCNCTHMYDIMTYRPTIRTQFRKNICFGAHTVIAGYSGRRQQSST